MSGAAIRTVLTPVLFLLLAALATGPASAQERPVYGTRAQAMGGTTVAVSDDASAAFGNPACFAFEHGWDLTFPLIVFGADVQGEILATADAISNDFDSSSLSEIQSALDDGSVTQGQRANAIDAIAFQIPRFEEPGQGVTLRATAGPAFRYKNWGISLSALAYGGASPVVDLTTGLSLSSGGFASAVPSTPNDCGGDAFCLGFAATLVTDSGGQLTPAQAEQLVFDAGIGRLGRNQRAQSVLRDMVVQTAAGGQTLFSNTSGATTRGVLITQAAFTYSREIIDDRFAAGASLKYMHGETYLSDLVVEDFESSSEIRDEISDRDNREASNQLGVDVGVLFKPVSGLRLGLSGTNLNAPEFDFKSGSGTFKMDPLVRAGVSWSFKNWITLAGDLDLNEIDSHVADDVKYRYGSAGAEFVLLKFLALRGGLYKNLAQDEAALVYTGGIGFKFGSFEFALSGAISTDEQAIESNNGGGQADTVPSSAGIGIAFNWKSRRS